MSFDINHSIGMKCGQTLLQLACANKQGASIRLLVERGADVAARNALGRSCLHYFLAGNYPLMDMEESLIYLFKAGADVHALDHLGMTVSKVAYSRPRFGSYIGDVWDVALTKCGYDVQSFRRHHPRQSRYMDGYSRDIFERLWIDIEHLCSYYCEEELDKPQPSLDFKAI